MLRLFVLLVLLLCPVLVHAVPAQAYVITDLGPVLNVILDKGSGTVVATRLLHGLQRAVILGAAERTLDLLPEGVSMVPLGVDRGRVVGFASTGPFGLFTHGFLFDPETGLRDLGTLGGPALFSAATDINGSLDISGFAEDPVTGSPSVPILWPQAGAPVQLPTLGGARGVVLALNDAGAGVGDSATAAGDTHAALWLGGVVVDLQTHPSASLSIATDINEVFQIVGTAFVPLASGFRVRYPAEMDLLPPLPGDSSAQAFACNFQGDTVGRSFLPAPEQAVLLHQAAVIWSELDSTPVDLATLVPALDDWALLSAAGINTAGQIAGIGTRGDGEVHAFLLTPTTAPALVAMAQRHRQHHRQVDHAAVQAWLASQR